jgi:hypothetical protein
MQVATRYPAIVRITPAHEEETLLRDLEESLRSQAQIQNIPITRLMVVELLERDADALFDIQALSTPEQPVGVEGWGPTQWDYYITPRRAGQSLIIVRVMAVVILPGFGERRRDLLVFEQDVEVSAHLPSVGDTPLREPQVQPLSPKSLIALGEISSALDILARTLPPAWQNDLILLQARHAALQHDIQAGILSQEQIQLQRNQLIYHLLQLIDKASGGS